MNQSYKPVNAVKQKLLPKRVVASALACFQYISPKTWFSENTILVGWFNVFDHFCFGQVG